MASDQQDAAVEIPIPSLGSLVNHLLHKGGAIGVGTTLVVSVLRDIGVDATALTWEQLLATGIVSVASALGGHWMLNVRKVAERVAEESDQG